MIKFLKVFEIDPELGVISQESNVMKEIELKVDSFFKKHIIKSIGNINSKSARFRSNDSDIFNPCRNCFSEESFDGSAVKIADHLKQNMHYTVKKPFILIVLIYQFSEEANSEVANDQILSIMKMEMNEGIQMNNNEFLIQPNMLPDLGNNLQKCAFIFKSRIDEFDENNKEEGYHLRILDRQDKTISTYFINLMNSVLVADDEVMSRLAQRCVRKMARKYTDSEKSFEAVEKKLNIIMSQRKKTSINSIVTEIYPLLSKGIIDKYGSDEENLAQETFDLIRKINPSAVSTFTSQPTNGEKYILNSDNRSIWISIEQGLVDEKTVKIDESDSHYVKIEIPKKMIKHK